MNKPNIFRLATKELSQDGFFTWLLQWADNVHSQHDRQLNETAKDFVRLLLRERPDFQINKVEAGRQWKNIDIWAEINGEYFIGIEDKTNTGEHSNQLERYKDIATDYYKDKKYQLVFVYLKTGNESSSTLRKITEKGYSTIDRKSVLSVLNKRPQTNSVFNEFKDYLTGIEDATNPYRKFENIVSEWKAGEGFLWRYKIDCKMVTGIMLQIELEVFWGFTITGHGQTRLKKFTFKSKMHSNMASNW